MRRANRPHEVFWKIRRRRAGSFGFRLELASVSATIRRQSRSASCHQAISVTDTRPNLQHRSARQRREPLRWRQRAGPGDSIGNGFDQLSLGGSHFHAKLPKPNLNFMARRQFSQCNHELLGGRAAITGDDLFPRKSHHDTRPLQAPKEDWLRTRPRLIHVLASALPLRQKLHDDSQNARFLRIGYLNLAAAGILSGRNHPSFGQPDPQRPQPGRRVQGDRRELALADDELGQSQRPGEYHPHRHLHYNPPPAGIFPRSAHLGAL